MIYGVEDDVNHKCEFIPSEARELCGGGKISYALKNNKVKCYEEVTRLFVMRHSV